MDISTITAVKDELCERITGTRIDKIQQPVRDMIILSLRGKPGETNRLLISVCLNNTRVHLTEHTFENPASPPMFCMLLRKHLSGAVIKHIEQPAGERMLVFTFKTSGAMGDIGTKNIILELFGRVPNIILTDSNGVIIDCLRRISGNNDEKRLILPGLRYCYPEPVNREITGGTIEAAAVQKPGISAELDRLYTYRAKEESIHRRSAELRKIMKNAQKRIQRKLKAQQAELNRTDERDYLRQCGDIITANMHNMKRGDNLLAAIDFYADDMSGDKKREIPLDPLLSPQANAAKYYKAYTKARNAVAHLTEQIVRGEAELNYVESVLEQLKRAESEQILGEIKNELIQTNYLRPGTNTGKNKKQKTHESEPLKYISSGGMQIFAGKNNIQNDRLTMKIASKTDIWLHAQKIHGAHVIIKTGGKTVDDNTLQEAASIAAYHSAARSAGKVPVDYTLVRYVKKLPGARPGMVTYTDYNTITVKPEILV